MDPESARRLASGFWKHEHAFDTDIDTWVCDKHKLHEEVQKICMNNWTFKKFQMDPIRFLDYRYGEGTGEAYRHAGQDRVAMRFDPFRDRQMMGMDLARGKDEMVYWNTGTTTSTSTSNTFTTTGSARVTKGKAVYKGPSNLRIPFKIETGGDLLSSLQGAFDRHTKSQMRLVRG
jgi:hypothetical protein